MGPVKSPGSLATSRRLRAIRTIAALIFVSILEVIISFRKEETSLVPVLPLKRNTVIFSKENKTEVVKTVDLSSEYILHEEILHDKHVHDKQGEEEEDNTPCIKRVQFMGSNLHLEPKGIHFCPATNCSLIYFHSMDYSKLTTMDAVILYHNGEWRWEELNRSVRPARQILIYLSLECARKSHRWASPTPQVLDFNWTMTFQRDADVVFPYGRYVSDSPEIREDFDRNWAENKTKLIAWMSSNCDRTSWKRKFFVEKLNKMIPIDMYGKCGKLICPRDESCDIILSSYKFYLALENTKCKDYISEKFWRNSFSHQSVPIVYGAAKEDYKRVAPPHSFVHLDDFSNISALVQYINYLDKNDSAYNEYFAWKRHGSIESFRVRGHVATYQWLMCDLLYKLIDFDRRNSNNETWKPEIVDMEEWHNVSCGKQTIPFE